MEIKKAIIPIAGLGTRFLPLSKVVPKEFWPLVDKPAIQYIIEEAVASGIEEIIFVAKPEETKAIGYFKNYFKKEPKLKEILKKRKRNHLIEELKKLEKISKSISFSQAFQKEPLGASHAVLQAAKLVKNEPCAVLYGDDVIESKIPCLLQMIKIFKKYQKPVIALHRIPKKSFQFYGMVEIEKKYKKILPNRCYKIKRVVEKPLVGEAPSNLALVGKHIITSEVFDYLRKTPFDLKNDITLSTTLSDMAESGKDIYGYEFEGKWLECGNKLAYLKSNFYLALKHPQFGKELRKYLRTW